MVTAREDFEVFGLREHVAVSAGEHLLVTWDNQDGTAVVRVADEREVTVPTRLLAGFPGVVKEAA